MERLQCGAIGTATAPPPCPCSRPHAAPGISPPPPPPPQDGAECSSIPLSELPYLYPGYRAAHHSVAKPPAGGGARTANADADADADAGTDTDSAVDAAATAAKSAAPPAESCCFCLPAVGSDPPLPLYTETAAVRAQIFAAVRGARLGRPLPPWPPVHVGPLMRERTSLYWANCHAVLLPSHLLLLETPHSARPFRVLPLAGGCVCHRGGGSLVFSVRTPRTQTNLAARDLASRARWLDSLADCLPIGAINDNGTLQPPRRRPVLLSERHAACSADLVRQRVLWRALSDAEGALDEAQSEADARVAAAIEQLRLRPAAAAWHAPLHSPLAHRSPAGAGRPPHGSATTATPTGGRAAASPLVSVPLATPPPSALSAQLACLMEVNCKLREECADGERDIGMLQRAVAAMRADEWSRGEWLWCLRIEESRTLWDVWNRARVLHQRHTAAAAAATAAAAAAKVAMACEATGAAADPSIWSALVHAPLGVGVDATNAASAETRKQAAATHDDDWFISFANKMFEL